MAEATTRSSPAVPGVTRVRIFIDFWNFTLNLNRVDRDFRADWNKMGAVFTRAAAELVNPDRPGVYEGLNVYSSVDKSKDQKLRIWLENTVGKFSGVNVTVIDRRPKRSLPRCPTCQREVSLCPACGQSMRGTEEKGLDTRLAADMIGLGWEEAYDVAILVSEDHDFVPIAKFLQTKGLKVIHASFGKHASELSKACWGRLKVQDLLKELSRPPRVRGA